MAERDARIAELEQENDEESALRVHAIERMKAVEAQLAQADADKVEMMEALVSAQAALSLCIPDNVCLANERWSDDEILPMDVPLGDLRRISSVIERIASTLAKHRKAST